MGRNLAQEYIEKGAQVKDLGEKIDRAKAQMAKAQQAINESYDAYQAAREDLGTLVSEWGQDPLNLMSLGQGPAVSKARAVAGTNGGTGGRGRNQQAIIDVLAKETTDGLTQAALVERVKALLGGGSDPSIVQATSKLYKDGDIRRTGKRGSFLYWALENTAEATIIKPGEDLTKAQQQRLAEVSAN